MSKAKIVVASVLAFVALVILAIALEFGSLSWSRFFAPRRENVRREVFQRTRSYNEAKEQELLKYRIEYLRADDEEKPIIIGIIRQAFADYDETLLTPELGEFLSQIKKGEIR